MINISKKILVIFSLVFSLNLYADVVQNKIFGVQVGKSTLLDLEEIHPNLFKSGDSYYISNKSPSIKLKGLQLLQFILNKNNTIVFSSAKINKNRFNFLMRILKRKYDFIGKDKNELFREKQYFYNNNLSQSNNDKEKKDLYNNLKEYSFISKNLFISLINLKDNIYINFYDKSYYNKEINIMKEKNKTLQNKKTQETL